MRSQFGSRRALRWAVGAVIFTMVVFGAALWVTATDQTKQADLGAGLVSTGLFGVLLLALEQVLSQQTQEVDRKVSLAAGPEPARYTMIGGAEVEAALAGSAGRASEESPAESPDGPPDSGGAAGQEASEDGAGVVAAASEPAGTRSPRRIMVEVDEWMRDTSRVDAGHESSRCGGSETRRMGRRRVLPVLHCRRAG